MFHIVTLLLFSSIMFAAVYQFWFNKNDMMMMMMMMMMMWRQLLGDGKESVAYIMSEWFSISNRFAWQHLKQMNH